MRYLRRRWEESRGDDYDACGASEWFFEVGDDACPVRQLELCDGGQVLMYDEGHLDDSYGMLGDQELDLDDFARFEITRDDFEAHWSAHRALNRGEAR